MEKTIQKETEETTSLDSLVRRKEAEKKLSSRTWSKAILEDVGVYSGYQFSNKNDSKNKPSFSKMTICETGNPKKILSKLTSDTHDLPEFDERNGIGRGDGTFVHGTRRVRFKEIDRTIATIRLPNTDHTKRILVDSGNKSNEEIKQILEECVGQNILIGKNGTNDEYNIQTNDVKEFIGEEVPRFGESEHLKNFLKSALMFAIFSTLFSTPIGIIAFGMALFTTSVYTGIKNRKKDGIFECKTYPWLNEVSEEARIEKESNNASKVASEVEIKSGEFIGSDDGTIKVKTEDATWTFNGNNGVPNNDAINLYNEYCPSDSSDEFVNFIISETDGGFKSSDVFESDCGKYYLVKDAY